MGPRFFAFLFLCCLSLGVSDAGAQAESDEGLSGSDPLSLRLRGCSHLSETRLRKILRLELLTLSAEERPGTIDVQVICFPDALVLSVTHGARPTLDRRIELVPVDVPERSVALSVSELISEAWRTDVARATPPASAPQVEPAPLQEKRRTRVEVPLVVGRYVSPRRMTFGGQVGVFRELSSHLEGGTSLLIDYGAHPEPALRVEQLSLSLAPHLRARLFGPGVQLVLGLAVPLGVARLTPETSVTGAVEKPLSAPWAAVRIESSLAVPLSDRFFLNCGGTASAIWLPVRGTVRDPGAEEDQVVVEISGVVLGLFLGLGARF